jgi:capsular polysaccharide transport system ATP-binding protein
VVAAASRFRKLPSAGQLHRAPQDRLTSLDRHPQIGHLPVLNPMPERLQPAMLSLGGAVPVIRFDNVTKIYRTNGNPRIILDKASFTLKPGISYGILGINGAGKSTTLRVMAGTEDPTRGKVTRTVRVSWPLGFAGGFHPKMSGRDNVMFVARVYGEDPRKVFEFVEDFSELGSYLDEPIYTYSSGMGARLAFGMSMAIPFDTYLIDEITSVGDARFSKRCGEVFSQRVKNTNVIMISHSMEALREYCTQGVVLMNGRAILYENLDDAIEVYRRLNA